VTLPAGCGEVSELGLYPDREASSRERGRGT